MSGHWEKRDGCYTGNYSAGKILTGISCWLFLSNGDLGYAVRDVREVA